MSISTTPLTEESVINQVVNYAEKVGFLNETKLKSYGKALSTNQLNTFETKSQVILDSTDKKVKAMFAKDSSPSNEKISRIITISTDRVTSLKDEIELTCNNSLFSYANNMYSAVSESVNEYTDKILSRMDSPAQSVIDNVKAAALNAINSIMSKLLAAANTIWQSFTLSLAKAFNGKINQINGFINNYLNLIDNSLSTFNNYKKMAFDFYKRVKGVSSTSEYIQANVPDAKGILKANPSVLATTPDALIIVPKLKFDINVVKTFIKNPLASFFPSFIPSLIPTLSIKNIVEPAPKSVSNVYGETQVKASKGGHTSITTDTPGNITTTVLHPSGSSERVLNDGSKVHKSVGDITQITDGNWDITTSKDKVEIVCGDNKVEIRKSDIQNVSKNRDINIGTDCNTVVGQDVVNDFKNNYSGKIANNYIESVGGDKIETTSGNLVESIYGNHTETTVGNLTVTVVGNINIICNGVTNITGKTAVNVMSTGLVKITGTKVLIG